MKKSLLLIALLIGIVRPVLWAQDDHSEAITKAIQTSDAKGLAEYFNSTVDLGLPDNDNSYSSSQGEMVMKDFFRKYPPESFKVLQKGDIDPDNRFIIGTYMTGTEEFKVYIHLCKEKSGFRIHKIKFEDK